MFGKRNGSGQGLRNGQGQGQGRGRGMGLRDGSGQGQGRGAANRNQQKSLNIDSKKENKMKVAFVTNNGTTVAKHIGLAKKIAFYQFPEGELIEIVENPIMKKIKDEGIKLDKESEGNRHLDVGHKIPAFLKQNSVDAFVTYEFGKGVKDNLLEFGITPVVPQSHNIEEIIEMIKKNQENR
ncbi:NifB/NifX family molybdenum-iron cluster-binding protein [Sulfurovum sp.]|uniref:NifB/NifX family molybdenum-iron cluster-binding protein n=1 Tax=Sulfurovum sp. TaxID=1969726 RepID=UPI0025FDF1AB|nr:NifB/NifX family molybdenum-iron cluster-binding protein [Sulfurovum sp.]